jgi:uncharacterized protein (DUF2384 family)
MPALHSGSSKVCEWERIANSNEKAFDLDAICALRSVLDEQEIYALVASQSALALHQKNHESLTEDESARLKMVAGIIHHIATTFGIDQVRSWLHEPFLRFQRRTPLQMMGDHQGAEQVQEYLVQIDEGYFA